MKSAEKPRILVSLVFLIVLLSVITQACAHIPCMCGKSPDECECFIQLGDKGPAVKKIISILIGKGYLKKPKKKTEFTPEVRDAVIRFQSDHHLECTGWMDDETLDTLLCDELPDETVKYAEERWSDICFVPTDGGIRYHWDPNCCEMNHPRMITRVNAEKLKIHQCGLEKSYSAGMNLLDFQSAGLGARILPDEYYAEKDKTQRASMTDNAEGVYVGNKNSHVFHLGTCKYARDMSEKNRIEFQSREEAIEKGYRPCGKCNP